jgi:hypothetical protein
VAADRHPGEGAVAGQPPTCLGVQGSHRVGFPAHPTRTQEAGQVHRHRQLGPDPAALGEPPALQGAAGQLEPGRRPGADRRSGCPGRRGGGPGAPGRPPRSGRPQGPTAPGGRPCPPRSEPATTPAAGAAARRGPRRRRGRPPAADGRSPAAAGAGPTAEPPPAAPVQPRQRGDRGGRGCWPGRRSIRPCRAMSRSARAGSASPPTSWAASSWSSAATADSPAGVPVGVLVEWVFEFMAGTYQPPTPTQAPTPIWGQTSWTAARIP